MRRRPGAGPGSAVSSSRWRPPRRPRRRAGAGPRRRASHSASTVETPARTALSSAPVVRIETPEPLDVSWSRSSGAAGTARDPLQHFAVPRAKPRRFRGARARGPASTVVRRRRQDAAARRGLPPASTPVPADSCRSARGLTGRRFASERSASRSDEIRMRVLERHPRFVVERACVPLRRSPAIERGTARAFGRSPAAIDSRA